LIQTDTNATKKEKPMFKPRTLSMFALTLPVLGSLALSSAAQANVRTTAQASSCQFSDGSDRAGVRYDGVKFDSANTAESGIFFRKPDGSTTPDTKTVVCTIRRDLPLSTKGLSDLEVRFAGLAFFDAPKTVKCVAYSLAPSNEDWLVRVRKTVSVPGFTYLETPYNTPGVDPGTWEFHLLDVHHATMDFGNVINTSASKGTYALECELPDDVALVSIYSSEEDGISGN
jgi:hypothetical protein